MITLTGMREIARCNVCRDDLDALSWYMMPQSPRIALDDNDKPLLSLVWYRRDVSQLTEEERRTKLGGGILTLSVELSATDDDVREIRKTIAADPALHQRLERSSGRGPDYRNWWLNEIRKDQTKLAEALKLNTVPGGGAGRRVRGQPGRGRPREHDGPSARRLHGQAHPGRGRAAVGDARARAARHPGPVRPEVLSPARRRHHDRLV